MRFGMGVPKAREEVRREKRIPMEVGVHISGHVVHPGTETTFTENVSSRGARVLSTRPWKPNDRLMLATLTGSFRALARVTYCELVPKGEFAVGLEFLEPKGIWVVAAHPAG
ncbi:MAG: PilZ domain-containing protein [Candidatus Acidiferrales bacterium]